MTYCWQRFAGSVLTARLGSSERTLPSPIGLIVAGGFSRELCANAVAGFESKALPPKKDCGTERGMRDNVEAGNPWCL